MAKRQQGSLFSTTKLYSDTQSSTFQPELHDGPRPLIRIANGLGRSSQQKHTTQDFFILAVKLDSVLICLCVYDKKLNFLSWAIRPVFADPVTIMNRAVFSSFFYSLFIVILFETSLEKIARLLLIIVNSCLEGVTTPLNSSIYIISRSSKTHFVDFLLQHTDKCH